MANRLADGEAWLNAKLRQSGSTSIEYRRGAQAVPLTATLGSTLLKLSDGAGGVRMEWTDKDFLIVAADLAAAGIVGEPKRGDRVVCEGIVYELLPIDGEPPWRWSDAHRTRLRIHTKKIGAE